MFTNEDVSKYYDLSEAHYRRVWDLDNSRSLHYGYWDDSVKNFHEALLNINKVLADHAEIKSGEKVLDAGCGLGGSSIWLTRERNCDVTGISLNERQVDKANRIAKDLGLADKVMFEQKDYTCTLYPPASFDVVWAIESVCYAHDKGAFLKEAHRVLKPGGRLIIADFFKCENLEQEDADLVKKWANGWAVNDFSTIEEFGLKLRENDFRNINTIDATAAIVPSAKKLYRAYFIGAIGARLYRLFNPHATVLGKNNVTNAYLQYKTLKMGLWKYQIVKAMKM
ncbi:MAG: methyltransferase domain-containing protein [Bacteroidetes bacterium]|nr:MAG: methyltransferase domain-containing protein [Bacteroidota bacterium]